MNFTEEDYLEYDIKKGDHIEVIGIMQATSKNIYYILLYLFLIIKSITNNKNFK